MESGQHHVSVLPSLDAPLHTQLLHSQLEWASRSCLQDTQPQRTPVCLILIAGLMFALFRLLRCPCHCTRPAQCRLRCSCGSVDGEHGSSGEHQHSRDRHACASGEGRHGKVRSSAELLFDFEVRKMLCALLLAAQVVTH